MIKYLFAIFFLCASFCTDVRADVIYREANGMNGYYTEFPLITITYDGNGDTKYRLKNAQGNVQTGKVNEDSKANKLHNFGAVCVRNSGNKRTVSSVRFFNGVCGNCWH